MRFNNLTAAEGNVISIPYVEGGVSTGAKWSYGAHAQLAYALISINDAVIPGEGEIDYAPAPIFRECVRQACVRAIEYGPSGLFLDAKHEKAEFVSNGRNTMEEIRNEVSTALEECDDLVQTYFDPAVHLSAGDGANLIQDIIENRHEARYRNVDDRFRVN